MAKKKVAPTAPIVQEIPLADVTITWTHRGDREGPEGHDLTITGAQLGRVLRWMSYANHTALSKDRDISDDVLAIRLNLSAIATLQDALSESDFGGQGLEAEPIFNLLSQVTADAAAVLSLCEDERFGRRGPATITIGRPAAKKAEAA